MMFGSFDKMQECDRQIDTQYDRIATTSRPTVLAVALYNKKDIATLLLL